MVTTFSVTLVEFLTLMVQLMIDIILKPSALADQVNHIKTVLGMASLLPKSLLGQPPALQIKFLHALEILCGRKHHMI